MSYFEIALIAGYVIGWFAFYITVTWREKMDLIEAGAAGIASLAWPIVVVCAAPIVLAENIKRWASKP